MGKASAGQTPPPQDNAADNARLRDALCTLARTDYRAALARIDEITLPWYRCQTLAYIAWESGDEAEFDAIIERSLEAASSIEDNNRCVCASSWPIQAMAERGRDIGPIVDTMIRRGRKEPQASCRSNAFGTLLVGVWPAGEPMRRRVMAELWEAARTLEHWRCGSELAWAAECFIAEGDRGPAEELLHALPDGKDRRRIERALQGEGCAARRYFRRH